MAVTKAPVKKATPAKKAIPAKKAAATAKATTAKKVAPIIEDEPDLLADMGGEEMTEDNDESFDLLDSLHEDSGTAWMPADDDDQPKGIQGRVTYVTTIEADAKYGGGDIPLIQVQDKSDPELEWSVRGYHTVLRNQIEKVDPQVGDFVAIRYFGEKENRKGDNTYHDYKVAVKR
jgi:hypothetical protein